MKTTKKVLSIVLAVMLLVGSVVVGVSAESMVYEKAGSKLTYTATVAGKEANAEGVIEVVPGETVTVSVFAQANYYLGTTGGEIFCWTTGFFNTIALTDVTNYNYVNNYTCTPKVIASTAATQLGTGYNKGSHEGFQNLRAYSTDCTSPFDASTATLAYTFNFTVPESAAVGTKGEFLMPETCSATVATSSRQKQIYAAVNNSATEYNSGTVASIYPETIDLTGAILNFVVVSAEAPEVPCDYAALDAAIAAAATADTANCTSASVAEFNAALEAANAVDRNLIVDEAGANQATIDAAAERLNKAIAGLTKLGACDYAELDAAIAAYDAKVADKDLYANWADYEAAYNAAKAVARDLVADEAGANQKTIDDAAAALNAVVLEYKAADYSAVDAAKAAAAAVDASKYTAASVKAVNDAVAAVVTGYDITKQAEVDAMAKAINDAIAALVPLSGCNYAALDAAIVTTPEYTAEYYDAAEYAAYEKALADAKAVERGMLADEAGANQAKIDAAANALTDAYNALDARFVDRSALEEALALTPEYTAEYYNAAAYAAWKDAVAAGNDTYEAVDGEPDTAEFRNEVAAAAAAINDAFAALVPVFVDRSALEAALALTPAYGAEYYDAAAYAVWQDAVAAGNDTYEAVDGEPDTAEFRNEVADAAAAINDAFAALVPQFIDYSALEQAVAAYGTTPEAADAYTAATYEAYEEALFAAKDILANKDENAPASDEELAAEIAAAAKALEDAYNGLELAPVAALVVKVTPKQEYFKVGDTVEFDYLVSKTGVTKLQVKFSSGTTMTYTRTHSAVKITDNGDGTETWTIATKIFADSVTATAKAKEGKVWEQNGYPFSYQTKPAPAPSEDKEVKSVTILKDGSAVETFTTKDTVVVRIVAGPDTLRIRLVSEGGSTSTYTRSTATQDADGNWVWEITTRRTTAKTYKFDIHTAGKNNKLVDEGTDLVYTVTTYAPPVGPSTGNTADIVVSATVAKARLLVGDKQTVTVVTDKDALGVRIVDAEGDVHYQTKDTALAVDNGDGTLTWTFNVACGYADTFTFDVEALYSNKWMSNDTTVTYRVVY